MFGFMLVAAALSADPAQVTTREQAIALADFWGQECGPGSAPISAGLDEKDGRWLVVYSCLKVLVGPKDGLMTVRAPERVTSNPLYPPEDALADALSGPLELIAIRPEKPGPGEMPECLYRNQKVMVLNVYCTKREINTTGVEIIHPDRGLVEFYAEASEPISTILRDDYQQWRIETFDPHPGLRVSMNYDELQLWKRRRLRLSRRGCWSGFGSSGGVPMGCAEKTADVQQWWAAAQKPLLKAPPETWYRLVKELRAKMAKPGSTAPPPPPTPVAAVGAGPVRVIVEVREYNGRRPVVGARVTLRDPTGSPELVGMTGPKGKALFNAPSAAFAPVSADKDGLVPWAELKPMWDLFKGIDVRRYPRGDDEVAYEATVVPRAWLEANMKARTPEQAIAIANDWGESCGPGAKPVAELWNAHWRVTYPCLTVHVFPWDGTANGPSSKPHEITATPLYPIEEGLADALSAPLTHVGTGIWPGRASIPSCVYRNDKVFVVDQYCTVGEINPSGLIVIHPARGVVTFRAQGLRNQKVSAIPRDQYEDFVFGTNDAYPGLELRMGVKEVIAWEAKRHRFFSTPGCFIGLMSARGKKESGCNAKTPDVQAWWDRVAPALFDRPPETWYRLTKELRKKAPKSGKPDPRYAAESDDSR